MKETVKPIRRSKELAPLSREHHEGLLFVWKIRQGLRLGIAAERIGRFCHWFWQQHFQPHFQKEETELVPILTAGHPLIQNMLSDHEVIKAKIQALGANPAPEALEQLAQLVQDHIRFEERQLFSLSEQQATPDQLKAIEAHLQEHAPVAEAWEDEFWTTKRP